MKRILRSLPVKVILFILCVLLSAAMTVTVIGSCICLGLEVYTHSPEEVKTELYSGEIHDYAWSAILAAENYLETGEKHPTLKDENGILIYDSFYTNLELSVFTADGELLVTTLSDPLPIDSPLWNGFLNNYNYYLYTHDKKCTVCFYVDTDFPVHDEFYDISRGIDFIYPLRTFLPVISVVFLLLLLIVFITLLSAAGRRKEDEELHPGAFYKFPFDILTAASVLIVLIYLSLVSDLVYSDYLFAAAMIPIVLFAFSAFFGLAVSAAVRLKNRSFIRSTLIGIAVMFTVRLLSAIWSGISNVVKRFVMLCRRRTVVWKTAAAILTVIGAEIFLFVQFAYMEWGFGFILIWIVEKAVTIPIVIYIALMMKELKAGGLALANGDLDHRIESGLLTGEFKHHAEHLNSISRGMSNAIENKLKSERLKTELITNVSHDIKTPLTSIINYSGLIAEKQCSCAEHTQYAEVLQRKSQHLKRLLEDLVEVSKASSGNVELNMERLNTGVFLTQVVGEYEEKCRSAGLELVLRCPEVTADILADGRKLWRIFDNLLGNAVKYSLPGSRVYIDLNFDMDNAVFTLRNTSKTAINISPDELIERFVRGDSARSTDGNGLGLSIADSLTTLLNGKMKISVDGDLFKAIVSFPVVKG